jgi:putative aldouronate transport system substrate-binding protein
MSPFSRRSLLRTVGATAISALTAPSLTACGSANGSKTIDNAKGKLAPWPTYLPHNLVAPDLRGDGNFVQDAFLTYPAKLVPSVADKPGDGSVVTAIVLSYGAPPTPKDQSKLWQAINQALGVDLRLTIVPAADAPAKYATMMASGDLPDIIATVDPNSVADSLQFIQAKCADLTPYLSGDAIRQYPNLAGIPPYAWQTMGQLGDKIYGVPVTRSRIGGQLYGNQAELAGAGISGTAVTIEQFTSGIGQLTAGKKYGLIGAGGWNQGWHAQSFGVPNGWQLKNGTFTSQYETPQYAEMLKTLADWFAKGYYYPDTLTTQLPQAKVLFLNGTAATIGDGFAGFKYYVTAAQGSPLVVDFVRPYHVTGTSPVAYVGGGIATGFGTALKQAPPARIKMLLRVLDYLTAPFGSTEYELLNFGVDGVHFTRDPGTGAPLPTALWKGGENTTNLPLGLIAGPSIPLFYNGAPDATKRAFQAQKDLSPLGVSNPALGLISATNSKRSSSLGAILQSAVNDIVTGKQSASSWDSVVKQWKTDGGDKIAAEYAAQYAAANKA